MDNKGITISISVQPIKAPLAFLAGVDELASFYVNNRTGPESVTEEEIISALRYYAEMLESQINT